MPCTWKADPYSPMACAGVLTAAAEVTRITDPGLVYPVGVEGIGVAEHGVPLTEDVVLLRPDQIASGVIGVHAAVFEHLAGEAVIGRKVVIELHQIFIRVVLKPEIALEEVARGVGQWDRRQSPVRVDQVLHCGIKHALGNDVASEGLARHRVADDEVAGCLSAPLRV